MGGGFYDGDVEERASSTREEIFAYSQVSTGSRRTEVHPDLDPSGKKRLRCEARSPIVVALDVTRSRGEDSKVIYEKLPMFIGQLEMKAYVENPEISFCAIGDASCDQAPIQVGEFAADNRLDEILSKFWLEEGGGGTGQESYELAAYFYQRCDLSQWKRDGHKGYFFFIGDEGFYPQVAQAQIRKHLGVTSRKDHSSAEIFAKLQRKFHTFFIYPQKSWEERRQDIDAEIRQRVVQAGGQYDNVDIRASLLWNNRNDLDLHLIPPSGEEIYYGHKRSGCGGWLDVDMNVQGETIKPVENIRWGRGLAPAGRYRVFVRNYAFHGQGKAPTPFRVELEINGDLKHFEGSISPNRETGSSSDITAFEFNYDPEQRLATGPEFSAEEYAAYDDATIRAQWAGVLPSENILVIEDPRGIVDVMLGALALVAQRRDLEGYLVDMRDRDQSAQRCEQTAQALNALSESTALAKVDLRGRLPAKSEGKQRRGRSRRL